MCYKEEKAQVCSHFMKIVRHIFPYKYILNAIIKCFK